MQAKLSGDLLAEIQEARSERSLNLRFPRVEFAADYVREKPLIDPGMEDAFATAVVMNDLAGICVDRSHFSTVGRISHPGEE